MFHAPKLHFRSQKHVRMVPGTRQLCTARRLFCRFLWPLDVAKDKTGPVGVKQSKRSEAKRRTGLAEQLQAACEDPASPERSSSGTARSAPFETASNCVDEIYSTKSMNSIVRCVLSQTGTSVLGSDRAGRCGSQWPRGCGGSNRDCIAVTVGWAGCRAFALRVDPRGCYQVAVGPQVQPCNRCKQKPWTLIALAMSIGVDCIGGEETSYCLGSPLLDSHCSATILSGVTL